MNAEPAITATQATKVLPTRNGRRVNRRTVLRWMRKGCRGVRLHAWQEGGIWLTTESALEQFRRELTQRSIGESSTISITSDAETRAAMEVLEREGYFTESPQQARWRAKMSRLRGETAGNSGSVP